MNTHMHR